MVVKNVTINDFLIQMWFQTTLQQIGMTGLKHLISQNTYMNYLQGSFRGLI